LIDISPSRLDNNKAHVYLDGPDARLFEELRTRLGSEEAVQNALILEGKIIKLKGSTNVKKISKIKASFPELVGVSFTEFQELVNAV
jgi:hypothetical protein